MCFEQPQRSPVDELRKERAKSSSEKTGVPDARCASRTNERFAVWTKRVMLRQTDPAKREESDDL